MTSHYFFHLTSLIAFKPLRHSDRMSEQFFSANSSPIVEVDPLVDRTDNGEMDIDALVRLLYGDGETEVRQQSHEVRQQSHEARQQPQSEGHIGEREDPNEGLDQEIAQYLMRELRAVSREARQARQDRLRRGYELPR